MRTLLTICLLSLPAAAQAMGAHGGCGGRGGCGGVHLVVVLYAALSALGYWVLRHAEKDGQGLLKKTGRTVAFTLIAAGLLGVLCGIAGHIRAASSCGKCGGCASSVMAPGGASGGMTGAEGGAVPGMKKRGGGRSCPLNMEKAKAE